MCDGKNTKQLDIFKGITGYLSPLVFMWPAADETARKLAEGEAAHTDVKLVMIRRGPTCLLAAQPHLHAIVAPHRIAFCRSERGQWHEQGWEDWTQFSASQRVARLAGTDLLIMMYGSPVCQYMPDLEDRAGNE